MASTLATPLVGANTDRRTTVQEFPLGTPALDTGNRTWVYVQSDVTVNAAQAPVVSAGFHLTAATAGAYTADAAFAINEFGWVRKTTSPL
jgi:hypothetical protein